LHPLDRQGRQASCRRKRIWGTSVPPRAARGGAAVAGHRNCTIAEQSRVLPHPAKCPRHSARVPRSP
jgi:hypothetical protein